MRSILILSLLFSSNKASQIPFETQSCYLLAHSSVWPRQRFLHLSQSLSIVFLNCRDKASQECLAVSGREIHNQASTFSTNFESTKDSKSCLELKSIKSLFNLEIFLFLNVPNSLYPHKNNNSHY
jgi:hypothetical protein